MERLVRPMQKGLVRPMQKGPVRAMKQLVQPMQPLARQILICLFGKGAGSADATAGSADAAVGPPNFDMLVRQRGWFGR